MKRIQLFLKLLLLAGIYLLANLIPKRKNTWVFGAWYGNKYSDNTKAFFEYVSEKHHEINAIWITKDKQLMKALRSQNINVSYYISIKGLIAQLSADFAFVCQALPDDIFAPAIGKKTNVVNLWHGLPLKKIMFDTFDAPKAGDNIFGKLVNFLTPYNKIRNDYLIATSSETQKTLSRAFKISKERTLITGFPRNDVLLNCHNERDTTFKCIYMPTFRGGIGTECDLFVKYGFNIYEIDEALSNNGIKLYLRMHPVNKPPQMLIDEIEKSYNIFFDNSEDIFDTLTSYDCLITDFSGAYFDFLLMDKPILFAPFDLDNYLNKERPLYYDYKTVTFEPYSHNWNELIKNLIVISKQQNSKKEVDEYQKIKKLFHDKLPKDVNSFSENLIKKLQERTNKKH